MAHSNFQFKKFRRNVSAQAGGEARSAEPLQKKFTKKSKQRKRDRNMDDFFCRTFGTMIESQKFKTSKPQKNFGC
jgi:protoporphyrinogen oxidase